MGGQNEQVLPAKPGFTSNDVRIHESGGEVHLHDDKGGLRVVVSIATFKGEVLKLDDPGTTGIEFKDNSRRTRAMIVKDAAGDVTVRITKEIGLLGKIKDFASEL